MSDDDLGVISGDSLDDVKADAALIYACLSVLGASRAIDVMTYVTARLFLDVPLKKGVSEDRRSELLDSHLDAVRKTFEVARAFAGSGPAIGGLQ